VNLKRRLEKIENHVKAWCGAADPPDVGPEPTSWFVALQETNRAHARVRARAGLTEEERSAWYHYWHTAAQLTRKEEIEAQRALIRAADLTRDEFKLLVTPSGERSLETQDTFDLAVDKWQKAWCGLDDETRALIEKKRRKEERYSAEVDARWPGALSAAMDKVGEVLETLDRDEMDRLRLRTYYDWLFLGHS